MQPNSVALVGERGPEFISSASQPLRVTNHESSRAAMAQYSPANEMRMGAGLMKPIDVSYNVTEINSMRFVTEEQMLASSRQAAQQGAKLGEQRSMNKLRQSRSTRSKLGM